METYEFEEWTTLALNIMFDPPLQVTCPDRQLQRGEPFQELAAEWSALYSIPRSSEISPMRAIIQVASQIGRMLPLRYPVFHP